MTLFEDKIKHAEIRNSLKKSIENGIYYSARFGVIDNDLVDNYVKLFNMLIDEASIELLSSFTATNLKVMNARKN